MKTMIVTDYKPILITCFAKDLDLLNKWHVKAGQGINSCVDHTFKEMTNAEVECHVVYDGDRLVGYFGRELARGAVFLTGFFVLPEHRNKENMKEFWALILHVLGPKFFCGLYQKNQPAIDFITRNNAEPMATLVHESEPGVIYRIKERLCQ